MTFASLPVSRFKFSAGFAVVVVRIGVLPQHQRRASLVCVLRASLVTVGVLLASLVRVSVLRASQVPGRVGVLRALLVRVGVLRASSSLVGVLLAAT